MEKNITPFGITSKDIKKLDGILIKANNKQIKHIFTNVEKQMNSRGLI